MNLHQQLPLANQLASLPLAKPVAQNLYMGLSEPTVANLQREQTVNHKVVRVAEPAVIQDLRALREEERNSEDPIAPRAFSEAIALLEFVHLVLDELPRTLLVTDGEGGIGIEWFRDDSATADRCSVRVIIPARPEQAYIYQRVGRESDITPFSKSSVVQSLRSIILAQ